MLPVNGCRCLTDPVPAADGGIYKQTRTTWSLRRAPEKQQREPAEGRRIETLAQRRVITAQRLHIMDVHRPAVSAYPLHGDGAQRFSTPTNLVCRSRAGWGMMDGQLGPKRCARVSKCVRDLESVCALIWLVPLDRSHPPHLVNMCKRRANSKRTSSRALSRLP